jgi:hypothetical protein
MDADFEEIGDQRRADRRRSDRRAPRVAMHTGFAATLVNHVAPAEKKHTHAYAATPKAVRAGIAFNFSA